MIGMQHNPDLARSFFQMTADILFHRLTEETVNLEWLQNFMQEIKLFIKNVKPGTLPQNKAE